MGDNGKTESANGSFTDPIGVELILAILSLAVSTVSAAHQFGVFSRKDKRIRKRFRELRHQTLKLSNNLDNLILTLERASFYQDDNVESTVFERRVTISETLIDLKERDYLRWLDIKDSINKNGQDSYGLIAKIRLASQDISSRQVAENLHEQVFVQIDDLLLNFGSYTVGDFVSKLRETFFKLDSVLADLCELRDL